MNIVQLNNFIEKIVSCTEIVKSFYTDSVYECWNAEEVKYGSISFCITKTQMRERTMTYTAMIYYGDRLMEDKSNRNAIWSDASQVIQSIIGTVNGLDGEITISYPYDLTLFEQKFADELAGAYAEIDIEVEGIGECGDLLYGYENSEKIKLESVVKVFTVNGEYDIIPSDGFDAISDVKVVVDVPLQMGVYGLRSNGRSVIEPDPGYEGFKTVEVDVEVPLQSKSVEFNSNGVYDVVPDSEYAAMDNVEVNVNIPLQSKSVIYSEVGDYEVVPDPGYEALSKVDVKVSLEGKTVIPNGFRFTGGDMGLVEWDKYDWSMVYDTTEFFGNCTSSDPNWFERFKSGFNGKLMSCDSIFNSFKFNPNGDEGVGIDFTGIDTSNVVSYESAFYTSNGWMGPYFVRGIDTSNAVNFGYMFYNCGKLTEVPQLDTSQGVLFNKMFYNCANLTSVPQLDTSNAWDLSEIFSGCTKLTEVPQLDTSNARLINQMYQSCSQLTEIPYMDTRNVTDMRSTFSGCKSIISIPELDLSNVENMESTFVSCTKLIEIRLKGNPSKLTKVTNMFQFINTNGVMYYDSRYDYSKIINVLPSTWTAVPYDVIG
jgi:hypothetical protein